MAPFPLKGAGTTYEAGWASVPSELTDDPLWRMELCRLALFAADLAWHDMSKLVQCQLTVSLAGRLYRAVRSIGANISKGHSRQSGTDQAGFHVYSLGSGREARVSHYRGRHVLSDDVALHRFRLITTIVRLFLTIIPSERGYKLAEQQASCNAGPTNLLDHHPTP